MRCIYMVVSELERLFREGAMGIAASESALTEEWLLLEARKGWELCAVDPKGRYIFKQEDKWSSHDLDSSS